MHWSDNSITENRHFCENETGSNLVIWLANYIWMFILFNLFEIALAQVTQIVLTKISMTIYNFPIQIFINLELMNTRLILHICIHHHFHLTFSQ